MSDPAIAAWSREGDLLFALRQLREENELLKNKKWVGLTDKDIEDCLEMSIQGTCRAIEAKLKEKNRY